MKVDDIQRTSGELRAYLRGMMDRVESGSVEVPQACQIVKAAAQINESIYAEAKIAKMTIQAGKVAADFGMLNIGKPKPPHNPS